MSDIGSFLECCLEISAQLALVKLDEAFNILSVNKGFQQLVGGNADLAGVNLASLLLPESRGLLAGWICRRAMPVRLNFKGNGAGNVSLQTFWSEVGDGFLFYGEKLLLTDSEIVGKMTLLNNEMAAMTRELNRKNRALTEARDQIKTLSGIIPICMHCKEIRDDKGFWNQLESFISRHSEAEFSHGICPKCLEERYPGSEG